jgi:hypothetical protein
LVSFFKINIRILKIFLVREVETLRGSEVQTLRGSEVETLRGSEVETFEARDARCLRVHGLKSS